MKKSRQNLSLLARNIVFGVEDSLASTTGLLAGVAAAGSEMGNIVTAGVVLIFVEAFSMAVGSLLSEQAAEEAAAGKEVGIHRSVVGAVVMFVSYLVAGMVPLFPYFYLPLQSALILSIALALAALFVLGFVGAYLLHHHPLRRALTMLVIGGFAILVGVAVGVYFKSV